MPVTEQMTDSEHTSFEGMIGKSEPISEVFSIIKRVAPTDAWVLIFGESGTGKEMLAKAIHQLSPRREGPFMACDCSSLAPALLESEIFGHIKGAFSGAIASKPGLFELAHNGTLFLDEISSISLEAQSKLLRVLETRRVKRVGDVAEQEVDIRLIAATNQDLKEMVRAHSFRMDLFYRLHVVPITLPPLRERSSDIPRLARDFLVRCSAKNRSGVEKFSPEAIEILTRYHWPGNVRELRNLVERLTILCEDNTIQPEHLPAEIKGESEGPLTPRNWEELKVLRQKVREEASLELERKFIQHALKEAKGNVSKAARNVGMPRATFHVLVKKCGMAGTTRRSSREAYGDNFVRNPG